MAPPWINSSHNTPPKSQEVKGRLQVTIKKSKRETLFEFNETLHREAEATCSSSCATRGGDIQYWERYVQVIQYRDALERIL